MDAENARDIEKQLRAAGTRARADHAAGYTPSAMTFLGVAAPEIRKIFEIAGGKLGATGCVAWMFDRKGLFLIAAESVDEEQLMELALDAGADDVSRDGDNYLVTCEVEAYSAASGRDVSREDLLYWEVFGNLRWGIFTLVQARPFLDSQS